MRRRNPTVPLRPPTLPPVLLAAQHPATAVRTHVRNGSWTRLRPGVYIPTVRLDDASARMSPRSASAPSPAARARALALARISALVTQAAHRGNEITLVRQSAALVHGFDTWRTPLTTQIARSLTSGRGLGRDVSVHTASLVDDEIVVVSDVRATGVVPTVVSIARFGSVADGIVVLDRALRAGAPREALEEAASRCGRKPGARQARELVSLADDGAESPWESWTRIRALALGMPPPVSQLQIIAEGTVYYADLAWPEWRIVVEFDGYTKYREHHGVDDAAVLHAEKEREDAIRAAGWVVVRVTAKVLGQAGLFEARLRRVLPPQAARLLSPRPHLLVPMC